MRIHTASTRHIIDLSVGAPGDEGPHPDDLTDIIQTALVNAGLSTLALVVSDAIPLDGEGVGMVVNDGSTYTDLDGCSIVGLDDDGDPDFEDVRLEF